MCILVMVACQEMEYFTDHAATMQNFFSIGSVRQRCEELWLPDTAGLVDGFSVNSDTPASGSIFYFWSIDILYRY